MEPSALAVFPKGRQPAALWLRGRKASWPRATRGLGSSTARGWAGNCAAAARALSSQRTLWLGRGQAWLSQHSVALLAPLSSPSCSGQSPWCQLYVLQKETAVVPALNVCQRRRRRVTPACQGTCCDHCCRRTRMPHTGGTRQLGCSISGNLLSLGIHSNKSSCHCCGSFLSKMYFLWCFGGCRAGWGPYRDVFSPR